MNNPYHYQDIDELSQAYEPPFGDYDVLVDDIDSEVPFDSDDSEKSVVHHRSARTFSFLKMFAALLALIFFAYAISPTVTNLYQNYVQVQRTEMRQAYEDIYEDYARRLEDVGETWAHKRENTDQFTDEMNDIYQEGIDALRGLLIERIEAARGRENTELEIMQYERYRNQLTGEYLRIFNEWLEHAQREILTT